MTKNNLSSYPNADKICAVESCQNQSKTRNLCWKHYQRLQKTGTTDYETDSVEQLFWARVEKGQNENDCWAWKGCLTNRGYPVLGHKKKKYPAHRLSFFIHNKYQATDFVLHSCDNPPCCNPLHLRNGSQKENMLDKVSRNRQAKGEKNNKAVLTEIQVLEIKKALSNKESCSSLGNKYGVSRSTISLIKRGKNWKSI